MEPVRPSGRHLAGRVAGRVAGRAAGPIPGGFNLDRGSRFGYVQRFRLDRTSLDNQSRWFFRSGSLVSSWGGQPLGRLRARVDGDVCGTNSQPAPLQGGLREVGEKLQRLWNGETWWDLKKPNSPDPEPEGQPPPNLIPIVPDDNNKCPSSYPSHLCCVTIHPFTTEYLGKTFAPYMHLCEYGMFYHLL